VKIDKSKLIGTVSIQKVQEFLKKNEIFSVESTKIDLALSTKNAVSILQQLENEGFIEPYLDKPDRTGKWFQTTLKGNQLKNVKFTRRISRVRAEEIVNAFLQRCAEVNKSDYYLCTVQKVVAFGSYVSESPDLGDIDLVISLKRKDDFVNKSLERARGRGKNYVDQLMFGEHETLRFLRKRLPYISFHSDADLELHAVKSATLFSEADSALNDPQRRPKIC